MAIAGMTEEELKEYFEEEKILLKKVKKLVKLIDNSDYTVIHTGAGISTSAGIPDFRGPEGVWTRRDQGRTGPRKVTPYSQRYPTFAHMSIAKLVEEGIVNFVVSQNVDGLHLKSGVSMDKLAELHGNTNLEICHDCGARFYRSYQTRRARTVHDHRTGAKCTECNGELHDSIINFGENLPERDIELGYKHSQKSTLNIVVGTSLRVTPASSLPCINVKARTGKLVIINLQKTPKDKYATINIHAKSDRVFELLMKELGIEVQTYLEKYPPPIIKEW